MSKLWKLKEWLTLDEAADVLTKNLGENIKELDILRWAIAGRIVLSLKFWGSFLARKYLKVREPSEQSWQRNFALWTARDKLVSEIGLWSLPEAPRRQCFEVLTKACIRELLSPVGDEVTFCAGGIYQFTEFGGINGLLEKRSMEYVGNSKQASNVALSSFGGIFLADSDGTYLQLLDHLPKDKWRQQNPRHPDNFHPADFHHEPTICVLPNVLITFIESNSQSTEFNRWQSPRPEIEKVAPKGKADLQIDEIVQAALSLDYDLMSIPAGGKGLIEAICLANKAAIRGNAFRDAWKKATKAKKIKSAVPGV